MNLYDEHAHGMPKRQKTVHANSHMHKCHVKLKRLVSPYVSHWHEKSVSSILRQDKSSLGWTPLGVLCSAAACKDDPAFFVAPQVTSEAKVKTNTILSINSAPLGKCSRIARPTDNKPSRKQKPSHWQRFVLQLSLPVLRPRPLSLTRQVAANAFT